MLSRLGMLAGWIDRLDEGGTLELLSKVARYANKDHNAYQLVKEIDRLAKKYPAEASAVVLELTRDDLPTYDQEDIRSLLMGLIAAGKGEVVREVCARYYRAGLKALVAPVVEALNGGATIETKNGRLE